MTRLNYSCFILILLFQTILCLYEDQIGKFDWRQQYIGKVSHALFDPSGKKIVVATEENVVALLHAGAGKIEWRQILGEGPRHKIHSIFLVDNSKVCVVAGTPQTVRVFDLPTGVLHWESLLQRETQPAISVWGANGKEVVLVEILINKSGQHELSITEYNSLTGTEENQDTHSLGSFFQESKCHLAYPSLVCINLLQDYVSIINVNTGDSTQTTLSNLGHSPSSTGSTEVDFVTNIVHLKTPESSTLYVVADGELQRLDLEENILLFNTPAIKETGSSRYISYVFAKGDTYRLNTYDMQTKSILESASGQIKLPDHVGTPVYLSALLVKRNDGDLSFRYALSTSDDSFVYGSKKEIHWTREESLTSIIQVEMVDLPVSLIEAAIEEEFGSDQNSGSIIGNTIKRITSQLRQLAIVAQELLAGQLNLIERRDSGSTSSKEHLERDRFGLHKLILVVTKAGKVLAIDSLSGSIVWRRLLKDVDTNKLRLFVQRSSIHYPLEAQCTILAKSSVTGQSLLYVFHPISGEPAEVGGKGYVHLGYSVLQAMLLPQSEDTEFLKALLLLDQSGAPHVFPHTDATLNLLLKMSKNLYVFTTDVKTCTMKGYSLAESTATQLKSTSVWTLQLCSESAQEEIVSVVSKRADEKVHSQGRVLADRSVLYKYLNPNMIVVATAGNHQQHKGYLNLYLIDVVAGSVVFSVSHRRAQPPYHVVYAENWVAYSYYSEKYRRTELGSLELFEGPKQINSTAFSSFAAPQPLVDRQAFIYPAHITAMKDTVSEQGMTAKHILLGLSNGWIQELPRVFLDPRRPSVPVATPEMREEGIMPYVPELPIPPEAIINYNQTVANVKNIYVTPSSLESTGLVFAYGLDIFYTHVTPSRTFDILSDDFEYVFIALVVAGLTVASIITKRLAAKKSLKQAWK